MAADKLGGSGSGAGLWRSSRRSDQSEVCIGGFSKLASTQCVNITRLGWRYAFLLQLPFLALAFLFTTRFLTYSTPGKSHGVWEILKRVDYLGSFSLLLTVSCFIIPTNILVLICSPSRLHLLLRFCLFASTGNILYVACVTAHVHQFPHFMHLLSSGSTPWSYPL